MLFVWLVGTRTFNSQNTTWRERPCILVPFLEVDPFSDRSYPSPFFLSYICCLLKERKRQPDKEKEKKETTYLTGTPPSFIDRYQPLLKTELS